jgi:Stage II sporulation protein E (SpoIIE)
MVWHVWGRLAGSAQRLRRLLGDVGAAGALVALAGALSLGALAAPDVMRPGTVLAVPVLLGGLSLPLREFRLLVLACLLLGGLVAAARGLWVLSVGSVFVFVVVVLVSYEQTRRRERVGVRRARPDQILLDLRERLRVQGEVPPLPRGWGIEVELRPAGDDGLAGDFVVARVHAVDSPDGRHDLLDLALVDVSGKGVDAGTRALLLSGALGGLLGAVPPEDFLVEANRYLLQQRWAEGFATAAYLRVDLTTGAYRVESAGHPPVAHLDAGSGTWHLLLRRGPLLGVVPRVGHEPDTGVLRRGDAVLLYSDGVVEDRHRDIEVGVDRLLGAAERLVPRGDYRGGAASLVREVPTNRGDDRAIVMLWRSY